MTQGPDPRQGQRGQILVLFAVVLIGLMWAMALGIDGAQLMLRHRQMQSVADLATLAGARSLAEGTGDAMVKACAVAIANGYSCPGEAVVTFPATSQIQVVVSRPVDTFFLRVFGISTVNASAPARAMGLPPVTSSGYAIFAGQSGCSSSPELAIDWSGSTNTITGAVHSDGGIKMGGSGNTVTGATTYVCAGKFQGPGSNTFAPPAAQTTDQAYPHPPSGYSFNVWSSPLSTDFPCTFTTSGDMDLSNSAFRLSPGVLKPGVYCATGTSSLIKLGSTMSGNVTLISRGKVEISASSSALTAYLRNVLLYAHGTGDGVIKVAGSTLSLTGYVYAPNGQIEYSGSTNNTLAGSIIGNKVKLNGSGLTINASGLGGPGGPPEIRLIR